MTIGKKYITGTAFTTTTLYNDGIPGGEKFATMMDSCGTIDMLYICGGRWMITGSCIKSVKTI